VSDHAIRAVPTRIVREADGIRVEWAGEGGERHQSRYPARLLRLACPCAQCLEEMTGRPLLDPATVPEGITPLRLDLVGAYGIRITWSDGHGTGIYTFVHLRAACPCSECHGPG